MHAIHLKTLNTHTNILLGLVILTLFNVNVVDIVLVTGDNVYNAGSVMIFFG